MPSIDVCFTPALLHLYKLKNKIVVVIDIFRASSSICYGLDNGAAEIIPVSSVEECLSYAGKGFLLAAERDGQVVEGFDFGNSPFSYASASVLGRTIVLTTTNGTNALACAREAEEIVVGSFLNISALCEYLSAAEKDVLLLCSGWKELFNLEDTVYAGAVCDQLRGFFNISSDSVVAALDLYEGYRKDLNLILQKSSHSKRLKKLGIEQDAIFCLQKDICIQVPVLIDGSLRVSESPAFR